MAEAALGRRHRVPFDIARLALDGDALEGHQSYFLGADLGQFAVLQHDRAARVLQQRRDIRGDEILAITESDYQGRGGFRRDQLPRRAF